MSDGPSSDNAPRKGRKVRVDFRRNRGKLARDKSEWTRGYQQHQYQHEDHESGEQVRAKGAKSRKRTIIEDAPTEDRAHWLEGVITAVRGLAVDVDAGGRKWLCWVRRVLLSRLISERMPISVGDRVLIAPLQGVDATRPRDATDEMDGVVEVVHPRRTTLVRQYEDRVQVLAANVDQAIIVACPVDPEIRPHLVDRFIVAAHKGDLRPVLCVNKIDIELDEDSRGFLDEILARYESLGYRVLRVSAATGEGVDALRAELKDKTSVFVGTSGVGKSSLLNALQPGLKLRTMDLDRKARGQHTTTTAELLPLDFGGYVVDTPGIRQFELAHIEPSELESLFPEFVDRVKDCRYPGCRHLNEEGCAIRAAAEAGEIFQERYESYTRMLTQK